MSDVGNRPVLRVISGDPTPAELAVIVTVLSARAAEPNATDRTAEISSQWSTPARMHRQVMPAPRPGAWNELGTR